MKIRIVNSSNNKVFFINVSLKEKDLKSEINSLIPYVASLKEKAELLENKVNMWTKTYDIHIYKNDLEELKKEKNGKKKKYIKVIY